MPLMCEHCPNIRMKVRFAQFYLVSAALILMVTAVGKVIPLQQHYWCAEAPILGPLQPHLSNSTILSIASFVEFVILGIICFSGQRSVSCAACALWGGICVAVHVLFIGTDVTRPCDCLGGFAQIIPLPKSVLSSILLACAGWLTAGGFVAYRLTQQQTRFSRKLVISTIVFMLSYFWYCVHEYATNPYPYKGYASSDAAPYIAIQRIFYFMAAGVVALSIGLILRQRPREMQTDQNAEIES